jgi:hypothetical protein
VAGSSAVEPAHASAAWAVGVGVAAGGLVAGGLVTEGDEAVAVGVGDGVGDEVVAGG